MINTVLTAIVSLAHLQSASPQTPDLKKVWDDSTARIKSVYYGRNQRKEDLDRIIAKYEAQAAKAKDKYEFTKVMDSMIEEFQDSHFDFLPNMEQGYYSFGAILNPDIGEMPHIGAWFRKSKGTYSIHMIMQGMGAEKAGLRKGDVMLTIDGKPFSPVEGFADSVGKTVKLRFRRNGAEQDADVAVQKSGALTMFLQATRNSMKTIESGDKKYGYMHLWTMINDDFRNAVSSAVFGRFRDTDGFILDIRDGFGGRPEGFADPFFRPEVKLDWIIGGATQKQLFGYQRPLVVIINEGSRSAKEVLSYILKKSGRATLVGRTTAGAVLGTTPLRIADWAYLEIPMVEVRVDGETLEDKGVSPHVALRTEFDASGKDLFLEGAIKQMDQLIAKPK